MNRQFGSRRWLTAAAITLGVTVGAQTPASAAQLGEPLTELSLEDLMRVNVEQVFGAARRIQPATEAPSAVSVVTSEEIARYGYRTLADILRGVRGLWVTYDRNYSYFGARAFARPGDYNTRVLLVIDGHRLNDNVYDQAAIGRELSLDPATFQRVEIIRGPASALYGANAFFAVVNITTKRGAQINGVSVHADAGSLGTIRASSSAGRVYANGVDLSFSANVETIDGHDRLYFPEFDSAATNNGIARNVDGETVRGVTGRMTFRGLTLTGMYGRREKTVPTAAYETRFNDPHFNTTDTRAYVDVAQEGSRGRTRYVLRAYADSYRYDATYPYDSLTGDGSTVFFVDYAHGLQLGAEARLTRQLSRGQTFSAGLEVRDNADQNQRAAYDDNRVPPFETDVRTAVFGAYVQDELRVKERLLLTVGGRYDAYSGFDRVSPKAGVVFMATPTRAFKYLFGTAFRAPNAYEFDYLTNGVRNDALRAETIATNEVVWEEYRGGWLRTSVSAYRNLADRLLTLMSDDQGALQFVNSGRVQARGLEVEAEMKSSGVQALASYSWQKAEDRDTGEELTNAPRHLGKGRVGLPGPVTGSSIAFEVQSMSQRITLSGDRVSGFAVANLHYIHPLKHGLTFTATALNLFDKSYGDPGFAEHRQLVIPQDGRTMYAGLGWKWTRRP